MIRVGEYAVVDGVEHSVNIHFSEITLLVPQSVPRPDGWSPSHGKRWKLRIPRSRASRLFRVFSHGTFKGIEVSVRDVRPMDEAVAIYCPRRSADAPPDPVFKADADPGIAEWWAIVPCTMVTDVTEEITEISVVPVDKWS